MQWGKTSKIIEPINPVMVRVCQCSGTCASIEHKARRESHPCGNELLRAGLWRRERPRTCVCDVCRDIS